MSSMYELLCFNLQPLSIKPFPVLPQPHLSHSISLSGQASLQGGIACPCTLSVFASDQLKASLFCKSHMDLCTAVCKCCQDLSLARAAILCWSSTINWWHSDRSHAFWNMNLLFNTRLPISCPSTRRLKLVGNSWLKIFKLLEINQFQLNLIDFYFSFQVYIHVSGAGWALTDQLLSSLSGIPPVLSQSLSSLGEKMFWD